MLSPARRPFDGHDAVHLCVAPASAASSEADAKLLREIPEQLLQEQEALTRELGAPVVHTPPPPGAPTWWIGPSAGFPAMRAAMGDTPLSTKPGHWLRRDQRQLFTDAPDLRGILQTFSSLRSLSRVDEGWVHGGHCRSVDEAIERVVREVHDSWAGFGLRGIRWREVCDRHMLRVRGATDPVDAFQAWLTELGDFHTWVRPAATRLVLPYGVFIHQGEVVFTYVPEWTQAYALGVRPGWRLVGEDVRSMWRTTPGAPHAKPHLVARRLLSGLAGTERYLEARGPRTQWVRWTEPFLPPTGAPTFAERRPSGAAYLWIGAFLPGLGIEAAIEEALQEHRGATGLIVDLRGNPGGRLAMARTFRDRFLREPTHLGTIRWTQPGGRLGPSRPLTGTPHPDLRWEGKVRFLTDPLTWASAEDAIRGLQGLPHVEVIGEPSGGGSGRNRRMPFLPGWRLTVSQALTYDRSGHCIEGQGLPVDHFVAPRRGTVAPGDPALAYADRPW